MYMSRSIIVRNYIKPKRQEASKPNSSKEWKAQAIKIEMIASKDLNKMRNGRIISW